MIVTIISAIISGYFTHVFDVQTLKAEHELYNENDTVEELLLKAQNYYKMGRYDKAVEIYNMEKLEQTPLAMSNLAYFYVNGIYLSQDIDKAKELYKNAFFIDENYIDSYFKILLKYPDNWNEIVDIINQGLNLKCDSTYQFFSYITKCTTDNNPFIEEYLKMDDHEKKEFLESNTELHYEWNRNHLNENAFLRYVENADAERKEKVGTYISNGEVKPLYGTVIYRLYAITEFKYTDRISNFEYIQISEQ